jgi:hypothetical protein
MSGACFHWLCRFTFVRGHEDRGARALEPGQVKPDAQITQRFRVTLCRIALPLGVVSDFLFAASLFRGNHF